MTSVTSKNLSEDIAERGWRWETITQADGTTVDIQVPLTDEEFLHPQEGYHLPNSTFHDNVAGDTKDMLTRRYANDPTAAVFRDLIIKWGIPNLGDHCPDTFVAFGVQNKEQVRTEFVVLDEGVRPVLYDRKESIPIRLNDTVRSQSIQVQSPNLYLAYPLTLSEINPN
jgi:hypothetical protein